MKSPNTKASSSKVTPDSRPVAPPVYRPQPTPLVLQRKTAVAPPVYKPAPVQTKGAAVQRAARPAPPKASAVIQRMEDPNTTQHFPGRPPSSRNRDARHHYSQQKVNRQGQLNHIDHRGIADTEFHRVIGSTDAKAVRVIVYVDNQERQPAGNQEFVDLFKHPAQKHVEHVVSDEDAEVTPLSSALACFENDLIESGARQNITHRLALIGPYGACDGCKDRIRLFKNLWREMARRYRPGMATNLIVTYFYHKVDTQHRSVTNYDLAEARGQRMKKGEAKQSYRNEESQYGWDESRQFGIDVPNNSRKSGAKKYLREYIRYRSYNASGQDLAKVNANQFQQQIDTWKLNRGFE